MTNNLLLKFPNPLSIDVLHSQEAIAAHAAEHERIYQHNRNTERLIREAQTRADNKETRPLTDSEYYAENVEREKQKQAKAAAAADEVVKKEKEREDFLASSPAVVQIEAKNPVALCMDISHWCNKGYQVDLNSIDYFDIGLYSLRLLAPAKPAIKGGKNA
ncbi:MAG: hypothetical protein Q7T66_04775 [Herminiimonas sp.]|uniref:hypothetical protein n=1 Tax=Herminiimonas sp. TaxID=1926289 RepID=UPI002726A02F|nr:hypothetical protein [Herminiimonas sp.]MDO9419959.1 hypothetical protein [Herminiimonas sp.]